MLFLHLSDMLITASIGASAFIVFAMPRKRIAVCLGVGMLALARYVFRRWLRDLM